MLVCTCASMDIHVSVSLGGVYMCTEYEWRVICGGGDMIMGTN